MQHFDIHKDKIESYKIYLFVWPSRRSWLLRTENITLPGNNHTLNIIKIDGTIGYTCTLPSLSVKTLCSNIENVIDLKEAYVLSEDELILFMLGLENR